MIFLGKVLDTIKNQTHKLINYEKDNYRSSHNDLNVPYPNHIIHLNILEMRMR